MEIDRIVRPVPGVGRAGGPRRARALGQSSHSRIRVADFPPFA
jgi:hypothetical protein